MARKRVASPKEADEPQDTPGLVPQRSRPAPGHAGKMDREDVQAILKELVQAAQTYIDNEVSPGRAEATKYYKGDPLGNEEEGRSQIVMTTVRDTILAQLPPLLRTFFGTGRAVEFEPSRPDTVEMAEQQSAYITRLFESTPDALLNVTASLKDGLTKRLGFVKWWWEKKPETQTYQMTGLVEAQIAMLETDPSVTYTVDGESKASDGTPLYDCSITRVTKKGTPRWSALPPEEVLWNRDARAFNNGSPAIVVHRQTMTVGQVVAMGFEYEDVVEHAKEVDRIKLNAENVERNPAASILPGDSETSDPTSWPVEFYEAYVMIDEDGDHIPELRRYYLVGEFNLIERPDAPKGMIGAAVREIPIACWCPDPEPHTVEGQSMTDQTKDLQRVDTALIRGNLDSLGLSLHPRVAYQEGQVNPHDVLNTEIGAAIRTTGRPGDTLMEFGHTYVGKESFPLIQHIRTLKEERTGYNMESQGLNADALQSSTKEGVAATLTAAQARTELLARFYAEQIMVPLFRGLYGLVKEHQDYENIVRMNGKFIPVDPRLWDDQCEVKVKLMLGGGLPEQKVQSMAGIVAKQEFIIGALGPSNPLVSMAQYSRAVLKLTELAGHPDGETYFTAISDQQAQQIAQAAMQQPPKQDPATMVAQAQADNLKAQQQLAEQRLQFEQMKFAADHELAIERMRQDFILAEKELELKYTARLDEMNMESFIKGHDLSLKAEQKNEDAMRGAALDLHKTETNAALAREKHHLDANVKVETAHIAADAKAKDGSSGA